MEWLFDLPFRQVFTASGFIGFFDSLRCSTCHFGRCSQPEGLKNWKTVALFDLPFRQVFTAYYEDGKIIDKLFDLPFRQVFTADDR